MPEPVHKTDIRAHYQDTDRGGTVYSAKYPKCRL